MIVNEIACKLEIVQNIAKLFFQFVIKIKNLLLWNRNNCLSENFDFQILLNRIFGILVFRQTFNYFE